MNEGRDGQLARGCQRRASSRAVAVPAGVSCLPDRPQREIFELADAVLCAGRPVRALAGLSLVPEHRRGHGALYDAVNRGRIDIARLRRSLAGLPLPRAADGRLMLAVAVSSWLQPEAATSPGLPGGSSQATSLTQLIGHAQLADSGRCGRSPQARRFKNVRLVGRPLGL